MSTALDRSAALANHSQLSPLRFLERSASVFPDRTAIIYGDRRYTYAEFADETQRLARVLQNRIEPGDRVAYLTPNVPEMLIAHFAVPLAGGVLIALNSRLAGSGTRLHPRSCGGDAAVRRLRVRRLPVTDIDVADAHRRSSRSRIRRCRHPRFPQAWSRHATTSSSHSPMSLDDSPLPWTVDDEHGVITHQLHLRHHRAAQGRHVHPPRRLPELARRDRPQRVHRRAGVPVDAADVPLQRLVLPVGGHRGRRHARLPARGPRRRDLGADRRAGVTHL